MILYWIVAGVCTGIVGTLLGVFNFSLTVIFLIIAVGLIAASCIARQKIFLFVAIAAASVALGTVRAEVIANNFALQKAALAPFLNTLVNVEGRIVNDPERRTFSVNALVVLDQPPHSIVLVQFPLETNISYNDHVVVSGKVEDPQPFAGTNGREFDYPHYLEAAGVSAIMANAQLQEQYPGGWSVQGPLFALKHFFEHSVEAVLPSPHSALMEGVLLGDKRAIPETLQQAFIASSLVHIVVLSGYNIGIVASVVLKISGALFSRSFALAAGGGVMILFALMVGGGEATVRALLMALVAIMARYLGREALALRSLAAAVIAMSLWNPLAVLYNPSFVLSVLATLGLVTLAPSINAYLVRFNILDRVPRLGLREILTSTIAVQIYIFPALLYYTGNFSLVAIPANLMALPVLPAAMLMGFVSSVLNFLHPALAFIPGLMTYALLSYILAIAQFAAHLPFGHATLIPLPAWGIVLVYVPLTMMAINEYKHHKDSRI